MRKPEFVRWKRFSRLFAITGFVLIATGLIVARVQAGTVPRIGARLGLDVQPFPGTPDASPRTAIEFPALALWQIGAVLVRGSRSGRHGGRLMALPGGHGTVFIPRRAFTDEERVTVQASLTSPAAGTASGAPNAGQIGFTFAVTAPVGLPGAGSSLALGPPSVRPRPSAAGALTESFHSEPGLHPPIAGVSGEEPDPRWGDIFADAENSIQAGPLIFDPQGQLVYFQPLRHSAAFDVEVQRYQGQTVLTYWQGYVSNGVGIGRDVILNHNYRQVATVYAGNGYSADLHEFEINPRGDAFITVYAPVKADLSSIGGPRNGTLLDSIVQEIDIATGQVLWEWHAYGHVQLNATYAGKPGRQPYDFFHINSVQQLPNAKLLISARHTWALYEIDLRSGRIQLVIGGKHSDFKMEPGTRFAWQHDARMQPDGTITLLDNASNDVAHTERYSRALRIRLNLKARRATAVRAYTNSPPLLSGSQGSVQPLPDGNTFVGWGAEPYFTEFSRRGRQPFSLHFPSPLQSYRGLRFRWWGQPNTPPSIAAATSSRGTTVYASWDGATDVASWRVLAGPNATALRAVGQFRKTSFETRMRLRSTKAYLAVQALGSAGQVLGTSAAVEPSATS